MIYESITRVVISDYKWLAVMNRIENKELDNFGNNMFVDKQREIKESKPEKFDIRILEAQAIANPQVAYYFKGKRLPNKLKKRV